MVYIKNSDTKFGKTLSEVEENLRKNGMSSMTDAQLEKCKRIERIAREKYGLKEHILSYELLEDKYQIK